MCNFAVGFPKIFLIAKYKTNINKNSEFCKMSDSVDDVGSQGSP